MLKPLRTPWLPVLLTLVGCSGSDGGSHASAAQQGGSGGSHAAISAGSGGALNGGVGNGGATSTSGAPPIMGLAGGAGNAASGGATTGNGSAGEAVVGTAGVGGGNGASAGAGGRGPAPTFTAIYDNIITQNCGGAQCHLKRPTPFGYDFSSKSAASASWRSDVIAGNGADSPMFQVLNFGVMPKDKAALSIEQLYLVLDWIDAGALDN